MNKRYIDFVPAKGKTASRKNVAPKPTTKVMTKPALKPVSKPAPKPTPKSVAKKPLITRADARPKVKEKNEIDEITIEEMFAERTQSAGVSASRAKLGVIEDYQPRFVKAAEIKKRPLGGQKPVVKSAMAKSATVRPAMVKPATNSKVGPAAPRTAFLNTAKIEKRPLSKNVYVKKPTVVPREERVEKPVKIIAKPEKDSKAGLIIAIILTIILGAAAGTVAFLLLPK